MGLWPVQKKQEYTRTLVGCLDWKQGTVLIFSGGSACSVWEFSMCYIFSFHGNWDKKKKSHQSTNIWLVVLRSVTIKPQSKYLTKSNICPPFVCFFFLLSIGLPVSSFLYSKAGLLTCASNTWASLLIRLRSVLREIPNAYGLPHTRTGTHKPAACKHADWHTGEPPRAGLCELFSQRWRVCVNVSCV